MMNSIEKLNRQIEMLTSNEFTKENTLRAAFKPIEREKKKKVIFEDLAKFDVMSDLLPDSCDETVVVGMGNADINDTITLDSIDAIRFEHKTYVASTKNYNVVDFITSKYNNIKNWIYDYVNTGDLDEKITDLLSILLCLMIIFMVLFTIIL